MYGGWYVRRSACAIGVVGVLLAPDLPDQRRTSRDHQTDTPPNRPLAYTPQP